MTRERNELKAGAFIVITILLTIAVVIWINGASIGPMQSRQVSFKLSDDIGGLRVGDDVRLGGLKVGVIREIHPADLDSPDPRLLVTFTIPAQYSVHANASVGLQSSLTGAANLNIENTGTGDLLADGKTLIGKPDPKSALVASLSRTAPSLEGTLAQINTQTVPRVNQAVDDAKVLINHVNVKVDPVADSAKHALGEVGDLVGDSKSDIRGTLKNLNAASGTLSEKLPAIADQVSTLLNKIDTSLTTAQTALLDIQKAAVNTKDLTASLRGVIVDNRGKLDGMVASLKTTSDNLKEASIEIRHSPWRLLYKPTPAESTNLNLYDSAREFAQGAANLSDASTALRDMLKDPQTDRAQIQKLVENLDITFKNFNQVERKLWLTAGQ
ncbi:MAG TPA: MlaD family protein [Tepidisphaeraceae bacterium]|jgi:ABC-type transporter Mla subunit MlaD